VGIKVCREEWAELVLLPIHVIIPSVVVCCVSQVGRAAEPDLESV
jgi:hypothetical protein